MTEKEIAALIYKIALEDGMPTYLSKLIVAQSKHETDDYSSHAFIKNNNCFGYKYNAQSQWQIGPGIRSPERAAYANYTSIEQSTHELTRWIKRRQREKKFPADLNLVNSEMIYARLLRKCGYYGDSYTHYYQGLKYFMK